MGIGTLFFWIMLIAAGLTALTTAVLHKQKATWISFIQHFCGVLFVISGFVKLIDPTGTAFKMEQYFAECQRTFEGIGWNGVAGLFPSFTESALTFSLVMVILEVWIGINFIFGIRNRLNAWIFFLLVVFFTILTGYTYLTGYVPGDANFFEFSKWGPYTATNMKVTDCGCFGDFIKLEPRISFFKDIFLMFPALILIWKYKSMHEWYSIRAGNRIMLASLVLLAAIALHNTYGDEPFIDFRPFKEGVNIYTQREAEREAAGKVEIIGWSMINEKTGEIADVQNPDYMEVVKLYPPEAGWKVRDQIKTKPAIPITKISDFLVHDSNGNEITDQMLTDSNAVYYILSYKMKVRGSSQKKIEVADTLFHVDTIRFSSLKRDSMSFVRTIDTIMLQERVVEEFDWDPHYLELFTEKMVPLAKAITESGKRVVLLTTDVSPDQQASFRRATGFPFEFFGADDVLLKTIMRSNPGLLELKAGQIVHKWHHRHLPSAESIRSENK